jgi:hypothetical protein
MSKTAIARTVALAQLDGRLGGARVPPARRRVQALPAYRAQVFVPDDAFGSTEYRADSAERWARESIPVGQW